MLKKHCVVDIQIGLTENQLKEIIPAYDAAVVRSATIFPKAVIERATNLKVIGRAGAGLDTIDLGLVGFGKIARQVASRALAFGMNVQVSQRRATPQKNAKLGVETVDLKILFSTSDFISLHIPGTPENDNFVDAEMLVGM